MPNKILSIALIIGMILIAGSAGAQTAKEAVSAKPVDQNSAEKTVDQTETVGTTNMDVRNENKRRLEEELNNTNVVGKTLVDFPNRPSLGSLELAPLPGINDSSIGGPLPMAPSVSAKDLPNEQLLGRLTPEVFQEMADLERGNTFLKLQLEKERLKNDLEKLKASFRQQRLDEITKRENVVRTRIQWWQEQEKIRLAAEKKQAEEEALSQKIAEQEMARERLREEARQRLANAAAEKAAAPVTPGAPQPVVEEQVMRTAIEDLYTIDSIRGVGKKLKARLQDKGDGTILTVGQDDILPSGHVIKEITKNGVTVAFGSQIDQLNFQPKAK